jgi:hypothetical protein
VGFKESGKPIFGFESAASPEGYDYHNQGEFPHTISFPPGPIAVEWIVDIQIRYKVNILLGNVNRIPFVKIVLDFMLKKSDFCIPNEYHGL